MKNTINSKQACILAHQIRRETGCSLADAFKAAYAGNNTVNTKTSWTAEEINQIFSDKTTELLRKGYVIDLAGMAGHQGEIGKIIFKKNNCFYALVMENKSTYSEGKYTDHYVIWFGKYTEDTSNMRPMDSWNTLWINKFEATWTQEFVKISDNHFVTVEEAKVINKKWNERCYNNYYITKYEEIGSKYNKAILGLVRKQKGYKTVKASEISKITRIIPYSSFKQEFDKRYYRVTLDRANGKKVELSIHF